MPKHTTQEILQHGFEEYQRSHDLPSYVRKAARALMKCRTSALGGHVQSCPDGHFSRIWYNSCKHRLCPQCAFIQTERWLARQKARILACDHYHAIFTIPQELHAIWLGNITLMITLLFSSVRDTLFDLLGDSKYLGAKPGIIAALHTWSQTQTLHPHIHCLVSGGGLTDSGKAELSSCQWISVKNGFLLPTRVVMKRFRTILIKAIRKVYEQGKLRLPEGVRHQQFLNLLNKLQYKTKWNVHIRERYSHGEGVATYLARYMRGGPIKNNRIISFDGEKVTFDYRDNRDKNGAGKGKKKVMTLPTGQFIQRLLLHVPVPRMQVVRSYGIYSHTKSEYLALCCELLGQPPVKEAEFIDWQTYCAERGDKHPEKCPVCGRILICTVRFYRGQPPPEIPLEKAA